MSARAFATTRKKITHEDKEDDLAAAVERSGREVVVLLEPAGPARARPPLRGEADDDARPPLAVDRVRQVADVEREDGRVDVRRRA